MEEGSKPIGSNWKEEKEEEDKVLTQLKKTQVHMFVWGLLMASHKHHNVLLDALNGKKVPIESTPQEVLSFVGFEALSHPFLTFFDEEVPLEGAIHTKPLHITYECMGAKVPMLLIDNGSSLNVCLFRIAVGVTGGVRLSQVDKPWWRKEMELSPSLGLGAIYIAPFVEGLIYYQSTCLKFRYVDG